MLSEAHLFLFGESLDELPRLALLGGMSPATLLRVGLKRPDLPTFSIPSRDEVDLKVIPSLFHI